MALVLAASTVAGSFAVTTYQASELKNNLKDMEIRLREDIRQVDLNSAERRIDSHEEMLRLHNIQAGQIEENRQDIREIRQSMK